MHFSPNNNSMLAASRTFAIEFVHSSPPHGKFSDTSFHSPNSQGHCGSVGGCVGCLIAGLRGRLGGLPTLRGAKNLIRTNGQQQQPACHICPGCWLGQHTVVVSKRSGGGSTEAARVDALNQIKSPAKRSDKTPGKSHFKYK